MIGLGLAALPQKLLAEAVGFIVETVLVVAVTWHYVGAHYELQIKAARADEEQKAHQAYVDLNNKYNDAATRLQAAQSHTSVVHETIVREVPKIIDRPVYVRDCIDGDGRLLINAALSNTFPASAAASSADATMPSASAP